MPGLQARSPVGGVREATTHWCFFWEKLTPLEANQHSGCPAIPSYPRILQTLTSCNSGNTENPVCSTERPILVCGEILPKKKKCEWHICPNTGIYTIYMGTNLIPYIYSCIFSLSLSFPFFLLSSLSFCKPNSDIALCYLFWGYLCCALQRLYFFLLSKSRDHLCFRRHEIQSSWLTSVSRTLKGGMWTSTEVIVDGVQRQMWERERD